MKRFIMLALLVLVLGNEVLGRNFEWEENLILQWTHNEGNVDFCSTKFMIIKKIKRCDELSQLHPG